MDKDALARARQNAQDAASRARLATDPDIKREWQEIARAWHEWLAEVEPWPQKPRIEIAHSRD